MSDPQKLVETTCGGAAATDYLIEGLRQLDGWEEAVGRAKFYSSGVVVVGSSIFAQFAKAILDMDAELKKAGPT